MDKITNKDMDKTANIMLDDMLKTNKFDCSVLLTAYAETCRHIEELERLQEKNGRIISKSEPKILAKMLIECIVKCFDH